MLSTNSFKDLCRETFIGASEEAVVELARCIFRLTNEQTPEFKHQPTIFHLATGYSSASSLTSFRAAG